MTLVRAIYFAPVAGFALGCLYCLYCVCFRWEQVRRKYGSIDLLFWASYVIFMFQLTSGLAALLVWYIWL